MNGLIGMKSANSKMQQLASLVLKQSIAPAVVALALSTSATSAKGADPAAHPNAGEITVKYCYNHREVLGSVPYPREALVAGIQGEVEAGVLIGDDGAPVSVRIISSSNQLFERVVRIVLMRLRCGERTHGKEIPVVIKFSIQ